MDITVADPEFPRGGGPTPEGVRQSIILPNVCQNCMKMKEFGLATVLGCIGDSVKAHSIHSIPVSVRIFWTFCVQTLLRFSGENFLIKISLYYDKKI